MPRLFTGIEIPQELGERLSLLRGGLPGARWIEPANYHLTLRFIGDIDMDLAEEVAEALNLVRRPAFTLTLDDIGVFGTKKPHAIVLRARPSQPLAELQAEHERLVQRIGLPAETRKFTPHVTLARVRGVASRTIADYLSVRGGFSADAFLVKRFVLFSSRESIGGGPYIVEEAFPLGEEAAYDPGIGTGATPWLAN